MWKVQEMKRGTGETRREAGAPLGCSCQDSGEADIIHLISSYRLKAKQQNPRGVFPAKLGQSYTKFPSHNCAGAFFCLPSNRSQISVTSFGFFHLVSGI